MTEVPPPTPDELLAALDPEQRQVATSLLGPVSVLAGAGTGKTRAITHRIAYGVATGTYAPNHVQALTFTSRAASELRARLRALGAGAISARTFHAAALSQLTYFWPDTIGGTAPHIVESKGRLIGHAADTISLRVDKPTLRDLAAEIEWRKVERMTFEEYEAAAASRSMPTSMTPRRVVDLMRAYEGLKDARHQIDFEDVLLVTLGMIEAEPRVASYVRGQYRFFVVDEYQDVSPVQHDLLRAWLGDRDDVCVVGDASQTIFSFAGASASFLLGFGSEFQRSTEFRLERNYRSTPEIVRAANTVMRGRPGALDLVAETHDDGVDPAVMVAEHDGAEAAGVASRIAELVQAGARAMDCAVLFRVGAQSAPLEAALAAQGLAYRVQGAAKFFDRPEIRQAVLLLRGAARSIVDEPVTKTVSDVLRSLGWTREQDAGGDAARERWEALQALMGLAEEAAPGTTLAQFTADLVDRQVSQHEPERDAVTLGTLHSAKGLEWPHVFIVGASEGFLPIVHAADDDAIEEERRLFYVGITRARRSVTVSWSRRGSIRSGARRPSRFLAALDTRTPSAGGPGVG